MSGWLQTAVGALLVGFVVRDIFHTLWHPRGFGALSRLVFVSTWRATAVVDRRRNPGELSGPLALALTALTWSTVLVIGFALIYEPQLPGGFAYSSSLRPQRSDGFGTAVYLSMVTVATLGLGDVLPTTAWLRVLVPLEALLGFVLLTATITWVLQLYPALARRRALARQLHAMSRHDTASALAGLEPSVGVQLLEGIRNPLAAVEVDLLQYGETYYFRERDRALSLAANLPHLRALVLAGSAAPSPDVRHAAALLGAGLSAFTDLLLGEFVDAPGREDDAAPDRVDAAIRAFAADHRHRLE